MAENTTAAAGAPPLVREPCDERDHPPWHACVQDEEQMTDETTHFGFETVPLGDKQGRVNEVFHSVARRYDLMNDLMSAGMHRLWKDALVSAVRPPKARPFRHLDVAGGTGDVAFRILDAGGPQTQVTVLDINGDMLTVGRERAGTTYPGRIDFVEANAEALPLEPKSFDAYTIAFGIRNVPRIDAALREAHRVLKPGGHFLCLEFSKVDVPGLDALYDAYSFNVIPRLGSAVTGDAESYRYLVESIRRFPAPGAFARMIEEAGFKRVTHRPLTGGVVAIHSGWKI
jgi:demethylmenaquinone methyltransferase/2-methoxy-6-polyprenyl-1,4-benzoquinol methylase